MWPLLLVGLCGLIGPCVCDYCTERYYSVHSGYTNRVIHCSFGCCGSYYDEYCCVSNAGFIVGLVFAGIFVIAVTTSVICCFLKHKGHGGRVIQPSTMTSSNGVRTTTTHNNVFIVPSSGPVAPPAYSAMSQPPQYGATYPMYGYPPPGPGAPMPPAYSQHMPPPPAYSYTTPAYPPPTPAQAQPSPFAAAAGSGHRT